MSPDGENFDREYPGVAALSAFARTFLRAVPLHYARDTGTILLGRVHLERSKTPLQANYQTKFYRATFAGIISIVYIDASFYHVLSAPLPRAHPPL